MWFHKGFGRIVLRRGGVVKRFARPTGQGHGQPCGPAAKNLRSQDLFCQARNLFLMDFFGILGKGIAAL
jgi:hypothetical protein